MGVEWLRNGSLRNTGRSFSSLINHFVSYRNPTPPHGLDYRLFSRQGYYRLQTTETTQLVGSLFNRMWQDKGKVQGIRFQVSGLRFKGKGLRFMVYGQRTKCKVQRAKRDLQSAKCKVQSAKRKAQSAKRKVQSSKLRCEGQVLSG